MGGSRRTGRVFLFVSLILCCQVQAIEPMRTSSGIHVPIVRGAGSKRRRRSVSAGSIGLGDYEDVTYNVLVQVGGTHIPVVLDTGSSDLWVLSTSCQGACSSSNVSLYPLSSFRPTQLDAMLTYGDSKTGTYAGGLIGSDSVSLAGLGIQNQYFAAINSTNTSIIQTGSGGILGLGFPFNSVVWIDLLLSQNGSSNTMASRDVPPAAVDADSRFPNRLDNLVTRWFRKNDVDDDVGTPLGRSMPPSTTTVQLHSSIANYGPLIPRLMAQGMLDSPMFSITLQRDSIQIGGNEGMVSIGQLPPTVQSESLTWVSVRGYPPSQGGMNPPSDAAGEVYPIAWEIPLDDVWFDGVKLQRSKMTSPYISLSALVDTGNSLIRGPPDVVSQIESMLGGPRFICSVPHSLVFQIGGKLFPVDPRDFISQVRPGDAGDICTANIAPTDVPVWGSPGYLYSWNLGDPFLKGVLAAFHYGSLTRPSQNPPRVGLLSTVDLDADKQLCEDQRHAEAERHGYPIIVEPAPVSLAPPRGTGIGGVPLAPKPTVTQNGIRGTFTNGVSGIVGISVGVWTAALAGCMTWLTWRIAG